MRDEHGVMLWVGYRFGTDPDQLEALWAKLPEEATEVMVVMEPTRNAWVALAAWFRRRGATVVMIPPEQSADLRAYYNKHAKKGVAKRSEAPPVPEPACPQASRLSTPC